MTGSPTDVSSVYREIVDPDGANNPHSLALQLIGSDQRVLEVGCSVGHVTEHLVAAGNTVIGVEIDADAAAEASVFAERVHVLDLDRTSITTVEGGPFDVILLGDVLEHLRDPDMVLDDLTRVLAPSGRLVISVPNVAHIDIRLMLLEGRWTYMETGLLDLTHLRWFTRESLQQLLAAAGFVATTVERVRVPTFHSNLALDPARDRTDVIAFIEADPEAHTFQFVVEARRLVEAQADGLIDALDGDPAIDWPSLDHATEAARLRVWASELDQHNVALQTELDAWRNSRLARCSRPLRAAWARLLRSRRA